MISYHFGTTALAVVCVNTPQTLRVVEMGKKDRVQKMKTRIHFVNVNNKTYCSGQKITYAYYQE